VNQAKLERSITAAHAAGDTATLERLQAEYRRLPVTRICQEPIVLRERSVGRSTPVSNGNSKTVGHNLPLAVRLISGAVRELEEFPFDNAERAEVGGWMFGVVDQTEITVCAIRGSAWNTGVIGWRDGMDMSGEYAADWEERFRTAGWQACGIVHSHPDTRPDQELQLSGPDERAAIHAARTWGHSFAMVLVGRSSEHTGGVWDEPDWLRPRLKGWIAHSDGNVRACPLIREEPDVY
jgi:hypothetical protein